jgi:hypothetical protein
VLRSETDDLYDFGTHVGSGQGLAQLIEGPTNAVAQFIFIRSAIMLCKHSFAADRITVLESIGVA